MVDNTPNLLDSGEPPEFLTHFLGVVEEPFWSNPLTHSEGQADFSGAEQYQLYWLVRILEVMEDIELPPDMETLTLSYSIGKGFEPLHHNRNLIRHENDDSDTSPRARPKLPVGPSERRKDGATQLGRILSLVSGKVDTYETDQGVAEPADPDNGPLVVDFGRVRKDLMERGATDARDASIWKGSVWEFRGLWLPYGGDFQQKRPKVFPVIYHGFSGNAPVKMSEDEFIAAVGATLPTSDNDLVEQVAKLVQNNTSHAAFMRNAIKLDGVDEQVKAAIADSDNGPWSVKS